MANASSPPLATPPPRVWEAATGTLVAELKGHTEFGVRRRL